MRFVFLVFDSGWKSDVDHYRYLLTLSPERTGEVGTSASLACVVGWQQPSWDVALLSKTKSRDVAAHELFDTLGYENNRETFKITSKCVPLH